MPLPADLDLQCFQNRMFLGSGVQQLTKTVGILTFMSMINFMLS